MNRLVLPLLTGVLAVLPARSQDAPPSERDPRALLAAAREALAEVAGASYVADLELRADPTQAVKRARGAVVELGAPLEAARPPFPRPFRVEGGWLAEGEGEPQPFSAAFDGRHARYPLHERELLVEEEVAAGAFARLEAYMLLLPGWTDPGPLEVTAGVEVQLEEREQIAGVACERVLMRRELAAPRGAALDAPARVVEQRVWLGAEDHLPRRFRLELVERRQDADAVLFHVDATARELRTGVELAPERFVLAAPEGYRIERPRRAGGGKLAVGDPAPDWTLSDADGGQHSLSDLRGKVVVLDFWATWCSPCKRAMPGLQKLHERFQERPVKVIGLSMRERGGDPAAYMREQGYTYLGLVKAESAASAYGVSGIPHLVVVAPDGKVAFQQVGFRADLEEQLAQVIEGLLEKEEGEEGE